MTADPGYHLVVEFVDRFDIETSTGCTNDFVVVQMWNEGSNRSENA